MMDEDEVMEMEESIDFLDEAAMLAALEDIEGDDELYIDKDIIHKV